MTGGLVSKEGYCDFAKVFLAALLHKYLECKCERRVVVAVKLCCGVAVGFCP